MKMIQKFADWLSDHAPLYGWEKGYQTLVHVLYSWVVALSLIAFAIFVPIEDIALPIQVLFGCLTVVPFVQELIRFAIKKDHFDISNVFSCIIGGVMGGFVGAFVWWVLR